MPVKPPRVIRRLPRPACLIAATALCVLLAYSLPALAGASQGRGCGRVVTDGPFHVRVLTGKTSCATARRVLRQYDLSSDPCEGSGCARTRRGWICLTASDGMFPRLASCTKNRSTIAAYSYAD